MQRGDVWFAATPGGDRPVLVLTRDPVADRIGSVVVAALTRTTRGLVSEVELTPDRNRTLTPPPMIKQGGRPVPTTPKKADKTELEDPGL